MATLPEVSIPPIPNRRGVLHLASELRPRPNLDDQTESDDHDFVNGLLSRRRALNRSAIRAAIKRKIASIECDDALILPHRANPAGSDFRERQVATYLKVAWQQIVRAFVTTPIDFGCGCVDPLRAG